ncbi:hypothetical protein GCM10027589_07340 [Actinocorallia lasiicapitis]
MTELMVKFRTDQVVRLRRGGVVAKDGKDATAITRVLAKYPGTTIVPAWNVPEKEITAQREKLEKRSGRELPDMNSWYRVSVPKNIEGLLADLNALPSVEIAQASSHHVKVDEPLRAQQPYRNAVGVSAGTGVDADFANSQPGGKGEGITVTDVETSSQWDGYPTVLATMTSPGTQAAGASHSLHIAHGYDDVYAMGGNSRGQLGDGSTTNRDKPTKVPGLVGITAVAAGFVHSLALKGDGTVWAWGANSYGQLGNGNTVDSGVPVQVSGISNAVAISAGTYFSLAVLADGTARAWGQNTYGQLGDGTTANRLTPVVVSALAGVPAKAGSIAGGSGHTIAVLTDGTVRVWGSNGSGQFGNGTTGGIANVPIAVPGLTGVTQVSAGYLHNIVRLSNGTVRTFGSNELGQLGNGLLTDSNVPVDPGLTSVTHIAAGSRFNVAVKNPTAPVCCNATVWGWGANESGQLGTGSTASAVPTPQQAMVLDSHSGAYSVNSLAAGARHVLANGQWSWGLNSSGQLGMGNTANLSVPTRFLHIFSHFNSCHEEFADRASPVVELGGTIGDPCLPHTHPTLMLGIVGAAVGNGKGLAGIAPAAKLRVSWANVGGSAFRDDELPGAISTSQPGDVIFLEYAAAGDLGTGNEYPAELNAYDYSDIALATAAGITVVEPAGNGYTNLDNPSDVYANQIMSRPDSGAIIVGAGEAPTVNGANCYGTNRPAPRTAINTPTTGWGSTYGSRVDVQGYGNCVTTVGVPAHKYLTPSETDPNKMYTRAGGTSSATPIVAGAVAALQGIAKKAGAVLTPAEVRHILKVTGTPQPAGDPHHIGPLPDLRAAVGFLRGGIAGGERFTVEVKNNGTVWAWGHNNVGQLGNGGTIDSNVPAQVSGLTGVNRGPGAVAAGPNHALAVKADGTVWAWGENSSGQLGDGTTTTRTTPVQVPGLTNVVAVATSNAFSLALKSDGTVWAWGANLAGGLGDGTTTSRLVAGQVPGLTGVRTISSNANHAAAVLSDGTVRTWGMIMYNSTGVMTTTPVQVAGLTEVATWPGALATGDSHTTIVKTDGTVWSWGSNTGGELGNGTTTDIGATAPAKATGLSGVVAVGSTDHTGFAVRADGTVASWGANSDGQLGTGALGPANGTPTTIPALTGIGGVTGGAYHVVALRSNGTTYAWGSNYRGQLGDGTNTSHYTAAPVSGMP